MTRTSLVLLITFAALASARPTSAEEEELHIFGYAQNAVEHIDSVPEDHNANSFLLQQLNLFLRKPISRRWTSFVSFEFVNSYSSFRNWGAFNVEEAWLNYRFGKRLSLKLGLQIPIFNNFNEIKNRTPLIPYVIRPLVYETSFQEIIMLEMFAPERAYVQASGHLPAGDAKWDYAVYLGNSPNVNDDPGIDQTGVDTTATVLVGGRIGVRQGDAKLGLSISYDKTNFFQPLADSVKQEVGDLEEIPRIRMGADFSMHIDDFSIEAESIQVRFDDDLVGFRSVLNFYYATLGYRVSDILLAYVSYWYEEERLTNFGNGKIKVPTVGAAYNLNDGITIKGQYARAKLWNDVPDREISSRTLNFYTLGISAIF